MKRSVAGSSETTKSLFCQFFSMFFYAWLILFPLRVKRKFLPKRRHVPHIPVISSPHYFRTSKFVCEKWISNKKIVRDCRYKILWRLIVSRIDEDNVRESCWSTIINNSSSQPESFTMNLINEIITYYHYTKPRRYII